MPTSRLVTSVEYNLPNGKPRIMKIVKHDVMQAPGGMRMSAALDHTVCESVPPGDTRFDGLL